VGAPKLFRRAADGSGTDEQLTTGSYPQFVDAIAPDAQAVGFEVVSTQYLALFSLKAALGLTGDAGQARGPTTAARTSFQGLNASLSPNGRYVAYQSPENGGFEVYVRPFPNLDSGKWQVSIDGGVRPVWSRNSDELFYFHRRLPQVMGAVTHTVGSFSYEAPTKVLDWSSVSTIPPPFDVSKDGRFLMIKENIAQGVSPASPSLVVVEHWIQELEARVAAK
jgi:serine/threonine-protein kinase